jgi:hypothetical protein
MAVYASWVHGNALVVENPGNLTSLGHFGWGGDMRIKPGKDTWFHIPIPTPVITGNVRTHIQKLFLLFDSENGSIRNVHIYDGPIKVQEFNGLMLEGNHFSSIDAVNTFNLSNPHTVLWGMSISFYYIASIGFDSSIPAPRLAVSTAGGDFNA